MILCTVGTSTYTNNLQILKIHTFLLFSIATTNLLYVTNNKFSVIFNQKLVINTHFYLLALILDLVFWHDFRADLDNARHNFCDMHSDNVFRPKTILPVTFSLKYCAKTLFWLQGANIFQIERVTEYYCMLSRTVALSQHLNNFVMVF